jgi:lysophospholipase L1-like esterase
MSIARYAVCFLVLLAAADCTSSTPTAPGPAPAPVATPPPPAAPTLACPSPVSSNTSSSGVLVTYPTPEAEGGQTPVTVACDPPSGATFPLGSTNVSCTATDALNRTASCVFPISVGRIATISKTKFLAFGDSITAGVVATFNPAGSPPYLLRSLTDTSYPSVLQQLLRQRYSTQTVTVLNEGKGGERAVDGVGRAFSVFNANRPEVVLIMDGYNDLGIGEAGIEPAISAINDMVKDARFRGARVFVATLTPPPVNVNRGISNTTIVRFNDRLKAMARGENAVLVDVYAAFAPDPNRYNSDDGRHPNEAGYRLIAETFLAAIRTELENR